MGKINTTAGKTNAFADSNVGGTKRLGIGKHRNVRISEALDVELGANKSPALKLTFENEAGATTQETLFYVQNVWVKGTRTEDTELNWKLRAMAGALVKDETLRGEVFNPCYDDTTLFERLVGFRCNIEVAYPKKGHVILRGEDEEIGVYDLGDDSKLIETFESFQDAADYMKEEGLPRAYTNVVGFSRVVTESGEDVNAKSIQDFIKTAAKPAKGKGSVSPLGKRTSGSAM